MAKEIMLSSNSTQLHISMENPDCHLAISKEHFDTILVETEQRSYIHSATITLKQENSQIVFRLPFDGTKTVERIRLDTYFSLIFNVDDSIDVFTSEALPLQDECTTRVHMTIWIDTTRRVVQERSNRMEVHTASLLVQNHYIPVNKEVLILGSHFFESLFDGNYSENKKSIYEIKDVELHGFRWFIASYLLNKWNFTDVGHAIEALKYADRFGFLGLHTRIFPYLLTQKISPAHLIDSLTLCGRFSGNGNILKWIFKQCNTQTESFALLHECTPNLTGRSIQFALRALNTVVAGMHMKERVRSESSLLSEAIRDDDLELVIVCHDEDGEIVKVKSQRIYDDNDDSFGMHNVWEAIPYEYNLVKVPDLNDKEYRREDDEPQECKRTYRVMEIHAFITKEEYIPEEIDSESGSESNESDSDDPEEDDNDSETDEPPVKRQSNPTPSLNAANQLLQPIQLNHMNQLLYGTNSNAFYVNMLNQLFPPPNAN